MLDVQNHRSWGLSIPILVTGETSPLEALIVASGVPSCQSSPSDTTLAACEGGCTDKVLCVCNLIKLLCLAPALLHVVVLDVLYELLWERRICKIERHPLVVHERPVHVILISCWELIWALVHEHVGIDAPVLLELVIHCKLNCLDSNRMQSPKTVSDAELQAADTSRQHNL